MTACVADNENDAVLQVERALDLWQRANEVCHGPFVSQADRAMRSHRLMELDEALMILDRFTDISGRAAELFHSANEAMMRGAA